MDDDRYQSSKPVQPPQKNNHRSSAQEISDLFARPEQHDITFRGPSPKASNQRKGLTKQLISPNKPLPARPGIRKPSSMISGNGIGHRASSTDGLGAATRCRRWAPDTRFPALHRYSPAKRDPHVYHSQHNPIPSWYSWSATPPRKGPLHADLLQYSEVCQLVSREHNSEPQPPGTARRRHIEITRQPSNQSSIIDRSLEHYTQRVFGGEDKQGVWDCAPRAISRGGHYTLPDLKRLASLSELDNVNRISAVQSDQHHDATGQGGVHIPLAYFEEHHHALASHTTNAEALDISTARSISSFPMHFLQKQKGAGFVSEASADPAASRPPVAQLGRQGHFAAGPADHLYLRDSTRLGNIRFSPDRVAWLLSADDPALELPKRGPVVGDTAQTGNYPTSPLWQTVDSGHSLGLDHEFAERGKSTGYSERPLTDLEHIKEPFGLSRSDKVLGHIDVLHEDHCFDDWIGHRKTQDACHQDFEKTLSGSHTESDHFLLYGPAAFLDKITIILDDFGDTQFSPAFLDPATAPSDVRQSLPSARNNSAAAAQYHKISNTDIGVDHSEEKVAAVSFGTDRLQRSQAWPSQRCEGLFEEAGNEFMGFTRPHILY